MAEQEEDVQSPTQLRVFSIVSSPPQVKLQSPCKQYELHPRGDLEFAVQFPPQLVPPQLFPQEHRHALVHTPEHPEDPQPLLHVAKQPLIQLVKHQLSQLEVGP